MLSVKKFLTTRFLWKAMPPLVALTVLSLPVNAQDFAVKYLVSDISSVGTQPTDPQLVNPWGLVASPSGPWWVSDNGSGNLTLYDGTGKKESLVVAVPQWDGSPGGVPSGQIFNGTTGFKLSNGNPAVFIVSTEDGTIQGWNTGTTTIIAVNNWPNAVYKGLALGSAAGANYIYAANFRQGTVDVFDANYQPHSFGSGSFVDSSIPAPYAPFNVANINGNIIVTYAMQDAQKHDDVAGLGHGYIRVFDSQGNLLQKLPHVPQLNSPWAIVLAPTSTWGIFNNSLLVGQFGNGAILGYNLSTNTFIGAMTDSSALPFRLDGLWGLSFGNGTQSGPKNTLYFTAGPFSEAHGTFGTIVLANEGPGSK